MIRRLARRIVCRFVGHRLADHYSHLHLSTPSASDIITGHCVRCGRSIVVKDRWGEFIL